MEYHRVRYIFTATSRSLLNHTLYRTVLSSAGNDGRIRLWKASSGNIWRPAGSVGVEQTEEQSQSESKDVEMDA